MRIEFSPPDISQQEIDEVVAALRSGWITTGPRTKQFERDIASYCGTPRAVCLNSATACMEMALRLFAVGPGDEVITSAYTYSASAAVIHHVGAKIVLVDTLPGSYQIDCDAVERAITARTKAIIAVDIAGVMCDYGRLRAVAEQKKALFQPSGALQRALGRVLVMADAAHSFGSKRDGIISGNCADVSAFSFHAIKNLTTAEGGALTWRQIPGVDDEFLYTQLMLLSLHGQSKDALAKLRNPGSWEYDIAFPGYKCNMTDIMAALGSVQLKRFPGLTNRRAEIVRLYDERLSGTPIEVLRHSGEGFEGNMHLYLVRVNGADEARRNQIITRMAGEGVASNVHFKPLPLFSAYKNLGFDIADFPNAYSQYKNGISLPLHTLLSDEDVGIVCDSFLSALKATEGA